MSFRNGIPKRELPKKAAAIFIAAGIAGSVAVTGMPTASALVTNEGAYFEKTGDDGRYVGGSKWKVEINHILERHEEGEPVGGRLEKTIYYIVDNEQGPSSGTFEDENAFILERFGEEPLNVEDWNRSETLTTTVNGKEYVYDEKQFTSSVAPDIASAPGEIAIKRINGSGIQYTNGPERIDFNGAIKGYEIHDTEMFITEVGNPSGFDNCGSERVGARLTYNEQTGTIEVAETFGNTAPMVNPGKVEELAPKDGNPYERMRTTIANFQNCVVPTPPETVTENVPVPTTVTETVTPDPVTTTETATETVTPEPSTVTETPETVVKTETATATTTVTGDTVTKTLEPSTVTKTETPEKETVTRTVTAEPSTVTKQVETTVNNTVTETPQVVTETKSVPTTVVEKATETKNVPTTVNNTVTQTVTETPEKITERVTTTTTLPKETVTKNVPTTVNNTVTETPQAVTETKNVPTTIVSTKNVPATVTKTPEVKTEVKEVPTTVVSTKNIPTTVNNTVTETPQVVTETKSVPTTVVSTKNVPTTVVNNGTETVTLPAKTVTETPQKTTETVTQPKETVTETKVENAPGKTKEVTVTEKAPAAPAATVTEKHESTVTEQAPDGKMTTVVETKSNSSETREPKRGIVPRLVPAPQSAPDLGSLSGTVVWDKDRSKNVNDGDERIEGLSVVISRDDKEVARTTTDENGFYRFDDLEPGDYEIRVSGPDGGKLFFEDRASTVVAGHEDTGNDWGYVKGSAATILGGQGTSRGALATTGANVGVLFALIGLLATISVAGIAMRRRANQ